MIVIFIRTILGLLSAFSGASLAFAYLIGIDQNISILLLLISIPLIVVGIYLLFKAGKSDVTVVKMPDKTTSEVAENKKKAGLAEILLKNNQTTAKWAKTVEKRDRLKMLEISSNDEDASQ